MIPFSVLPAKHSGRGGSRHSMDLSNCNLESLVGKEVVGFVPMLHPNAIIPFLLYGVEIGGIWVGGEDLDSWIKKKLNLAELSGPGAMFVPFSEVKYILGGIPRPRGPKLVDFQREEKIGG